MIPHGLISHPNQQERCENFLQSANKLTSVSKLEQRDAGGGLLVLVWKVLARGKKKVGTLLFHFIFCPATSSKATEKEIHKPCLQTACGLVV